MNPIGVFGGAFDPIHCGHIETVLDVQRQTGINQVHYIPTGDPSHRPRAISNQTHRLNMVSLATAKNPDFVVNNSEIQRQGKSYMVATLRELRLQFRFDPLCLILGADAFVRIQQWHSWAALTSLAHIIVMNRPDGQWSVKTPERWQKLRVKHQRMLTERLAGGVMEIKVRPMRISSTQVRRMISTGEDVRGLVPEPVLKYIHENNLYTKQGDY